MRRRALLLAGALFLVLGCGKDSTGIPQPDPKPRPVPPSTGMVVPATAPDTALPHY